jgi:hypothetical protein
MERKKKKDKSEGREKSRKENKKQKQLKRRRRKEERNTRQQCSSVVSDGGEREFSYHAWRARGTNGWLSSRRSTARHRPESQSQRLFTNAHFSEILREQYSLEMTHDSEQAGACPYRSDIRSFVLALASVPVRAGWALADRQRASLFFFSFFLSW